ncbi:MAG: MBL fold metallo-hydrolase [Candidatus Eremiobacteraeota bacterium]|nr:MBL fold metallo-hydrolase [Candidatus Eremiobacteraeota bacterium]
MTSVLFLGTGGARFVVARQVRASGGMWMRFGQTQIHVDPGPGALVRALSQVPPCNPRELDGIALSHKHLDHSGDVNALIEAMTAGGFRPRGTLLAPRDALVGEYVVLPYAQKFPERVQIVEEASGPYRIGDVEIRTSVRHVHSVETYGLHFTHEGSTLSYLPCGRYFDGLAEDYARHEPDTLIVNVLRYADSMDVDHLVWADACRIVETVKPKVAVFQHFGTKMLEEDPVRLAQAFEDASGIRAIAAHDGYLLDVATEVSAFAG